MRLIEALSVTAETRMAFVGAGGKSTSMFRLARQALASGLKRVIVTASTHLAESQIDWADHHFVVEKEADLGEIDLSRLSGLVLLTGPVGEDYRTKGLIFPILKELGLIAGRIKAPLLLEADGSRRLPLKAPAAHEPAIPAWVNGVVVCVGAGGLGKPLDDATVHRPEIYSQLSGVAIGDGVNVEGLATVLLSAQGGLKNIPASASRVVNFTQVNTAELAGQVKRISTKLLPAFHAVIASELRNDGEEVGAVYRQVAGVVLAAGESTRLGRPKQLLDWDGRPFVRVCAETALASGLSPVLVVTGAHQDEITRALDGLPVEIVHNPDWAEGQGGSVRTAVEFLSHERWQCVSGAMFLLSDQPQIPVTLIGALLEAYATANVPVIAPLIDQRRGNPVLFDRVTFEVLLGLEGDAGGRQVFSRFRSLTVPWHDWRDGMDVDTEEDYQCLLDEGKSGRS